MVRSSKTTVSQLRRKGADIGKDVFIHKSAEILATRIKIGENIHIGRNTRIFARELELDSDVRIGENCTFRSERIRIGENSRIGDNNDIQPYESFSMGCTSRIGSRADLRGRIVSFGDEVFITNGLRVGGGGLHGPEARFIVGDRCTMHNNYINVSKPVTIGNDVGFSEDTILITHGFWQSVLEGYSATFAPITIHDWVILGMRVIVLPGVEIGERTTVGAGAVVSRSLPANCVAVGVPARAIKTDYPSPPSKQEQNAIMTRLLHAYATLLADKGYNVQNVTEMGDGIVLEVVKDEIQTNISYFHEPQIPKKAFGGVENVLLTFNAGTVPTNVSVMNLESLQITGQLTPLVQDLRDFLRRRGIRFYGCGYFSSLQPQIRIDFDNDFQQG